MAEDIKTTGSNEEESGKDLKTYIEVFGDVMKEYGENPSQESLFHVLSTLFDGIETRCSLPCAAEAGSDGTLRLMRCMRTNGMYSLAVLSHIDGGRYQFVADVKLRYVLELIFDDNDCDGILIDPGEETTLFIPKYFLNYALLAGYQMALDDIEMEEKQD